jgi:hypothetical protein
MNHYARIPGHFHVRNENSVFNPSGAKTSKRPTKLISQKDSTKDSTQRWWKEKLFNIDGGRVHASSPMKTALKNSLKMEVTTVRFVFPECKTHLTTRLNVKQFWLILRIKLFVKHISPCHPTQFQVIHN